jgi:uncharacterized protein with HEPN domain
MSRSWLEYLRHILDEAKYLVAHSQGLNRDDFNRDETLKRAFVSTTTVLQSHVILSDRRKRRIPLFLERNLPSQNEILRRFTPQNDMYGCSVRSIEIIGEATKQVPEPVRQRYPHVDWRAMAGMRDRLVHEYFGIDYDIVWDVVTNKIPGLRRDIEVILQQDEDTST